MNSSALKKALLQCGCTRYSEVNSFLEATIWRSKVRRHIRKPQKLSYEVDDETAIGETTGGGVEEGFSVRRKRRLRKVVRVGETEQVSGVGDGIAEAYDRLEIPTLFF